MTEQKPPVPTKAPIPMNPELVTQLYALFNRKPPEDALVAKVVITLEAGRPCRIEESTIPIQDIMPPDSSPPQVGETTETKGNA